MTRTGSRAAWQPASDHGGVRAGPGARRVLAHTTLGNARGSALLEHVKGVIAEYEREKIRERTGRGRREKARRGLVVSGTYAYGFRPDPSRPGTLVIHEEEAGVVRMVYRWLTNEQRPIRSMATELRRLGIRPRRGRGWVPSSLRNMLTNPIYAGRAYFNRREVIPSPSTGKPRTGRRMRPETEWISVPVPPIVSAETFERAQQQLA